MEPNRHRQVVIAEAFDALAAERELHLQPEVFVEPSQYTAYTGMRSFVVFGDSGSGKTALRMALTRLATPDNTPPTHLVVQWQPEPIEGAQGSPAVRICIRQILDACATALLTTFARHPHLFYSAPPTAQTATHWFIQTCAGRDLQNLLAIIEEEIASEEGKSLARRLVTDPASPVLRAEVAEQRIIAHLTGTLQRMGMRGVWVMIDGLEPWLRSAMPRIADMLNAILSTLELFDLNGFAIKMFVPRELEPSITGSWGAIKGRFDLYTLTWTSEQLGLIIERHIAAKTGKPQVTLGDLCAADRDVRAWLQRYGGNTPRGWLRLIRPLVDVFLTSGASRPLSRDAWRSIQRTHPPRLYINLETDRVFIGDAEIGKLQPRPYRLLRYLYENRARRVPRSELYYRAYQGLAEEPLAHGDHGWEDPADWNNVLDNAILRLRKIIEPDPHHPVYILTDRGWGVKLENTR
ncbi:winged helix-turn-helix domain-containing protein [Roseiflexus sp.]|uniref:winged helix-turn-helix domain-containing protein n=1 Tax=Roseiflexus sp. TaxID=2562120 RepID=UPI00398B6742